MATPVGEQVGASDEGPAAVEAAVGSLCRPVFWQACAFAGPLLWGRRALGQVGALAEAFLPLVAFVRPLSRVAPLALNPGKGVDESFPRAGADMGLSPAMGSPGLLQGCPPAEAFPAVGSLPLMGPLVHSELGSLVEAHSTVRTQKGALACVDPPVHREVDA